MARGAPRAGPYAGRREVVLGFVGTLAALVVTAACRVPAPARPVPTLTRTAASLSASEFDQRADALAQTRAGPVPTLTRTAALLSASEFDQRAFSRSLARLADRAPGPMPGARVVLLPHHWAAGDLIVSALAGLGAVSTGPGERRRGQKATPPADPASALAAPRRVLLLGLDHRRSGGRVAVTASRGWSTPFGTVAVDVDAVGALVRTGLADDAPEVVGAEHSISGLVPAIRWFLPCARIVPLAIRADARRAEVARLSAAVGQLAGDEGLLLVSVDLAHDVARADAPRNDALCFRALAAFDDARILELDDRYMDARPAVAIGMAVARGALATEFVLVERTDSSLLAGYGGGPVTSYAAAYFALP